MNKLRCISISPWRMTKTPGPAPFMVRERLIVPKRMPHLTQRPNAVLFFAFKIAVDAMPPTFSSQEPQTRGKHGSTLSQPHIHPRNQPGQLGPSCRSSLILNTDAKIESVPAKQMLCVLSKVQVALVVYLRKRTRAAAPPTPRPMNVWCNRKEKVKLVHASSV